MTVRRIKSYVMTRLNGMNELKVPAGSHIIGVVAFDNKPDPVNLLVVEEVKSVGAEIEEPEVKTVLITTDDAPFSDPAEDKAMQYIGTVLWDNGYRVNHAFEIEDIPDLAFEIGALEKLGTCPEDVVIAAEDEPLKVELIPDPESEDEEQA